MAGKTKKVEVNPFDRFGSDDRATDAKSRGLFFPDKQLVKKPTAAKKAPAKKKK